MFDIGFSELVLLFGLGLMVLGPERLPKVAAQLGRWAGQARNMARNLTSQIQDEIEPIKSSVDSLNKSMDNMDNSLHTDFSTRRPEPGMHTDEDSASASEQKPKHDDSTNAEAGEEVSKEVDKD
jgi:Tat protein translocase TatB subunit